MLFVIDVFSQANEPIFFFFFFNIILIHVANVSFSREDEKRRLKIVMFTLWCLGISLFLLAAIYDVGYLLTDSGYPKPGDGQLGM